MGTFSNWFGSFAWQSRFVRFDNSGSPQTKHHRHEEGPVAMKAKGMVLTPLPPIHPTNRLEGAAPKPSSANSFFFLYKKKDIS